MADSNTGAAPASPASAKRLGVIGLGAIVLSSMIGGGIYSLPQNMAASAAAGAVIIAWIITGIGIFFIANSFRILASARPNLTAGIYMYSRDGFGEYAGFTIAWGYWLCQIFGNVGYAVITMDALNYFFPGVFAGGNNLWSIVGGSILIWAFNFVVLAGVRQASIINIVGTVGKLVPLLVFAIVLVFAFHWDKFTFDFWGDIPVDGHVLGGLGAQIKSTMLVTLWAFIGIEGAVVLSGRAKSQGDVGKATIMGFVGGLIVFILLSVLPFGVMSQSEIAGIANPSTAGVLEKIVGPWGAWLMNIGLLISVLASWLAWTIITAEMPFACAKDGTFPKFFAKSNSNGSPSASLWTTSALMQLAMLLVFFSNNAWNTMLSITGVMVLPAYLSSTMYLFKISEQQKLRSVVPGLQIGAGAAALSGGVGALYALWLIYAAGVEYLLASVILLTAGIPFYIWARSENGKKAFAPKELLGALALAAVSAAAIYMTASGKIDLGGTPPPPQPAQQAKHSPIIKRHGHSVPVKETAAPANAAAQNQARN